MFVYTTVQVKLKMCNNNLKNEQTTVQNRIYDGRAYKCQYIPRARLFTLFKTAAPPY